MGKPVDLGDFIQEFPQKGNSLFDAVNMLQAKNLDAHAAKLDIEGLAKMTADGTPVIAHIRDDSQTLTKWVDGNKTTEVYNHAVVVDAVVRDAVTNQIDYLHIRDPNGQSYYCPAETFARYFQGKNKFGYAVIPSKPSADAPVTEIDPSDVDPSEVTVQADEPNQPDTTGEQPQGGSNAQGEEPEGGGKSAGGEEPEGGGKAAQGEGPEAGSNAQGEQPKSGSSTGQGEQPAVGGTNGGTDTSVEQTPTSEPTTGPGLKQGAAEGAVIGTATALSTCIAGGNAVKACVAAAGTNLPSAAICGAAGTVHPVLGVACGSANTFAACVAKGGDPKKCMNDSRGDLPVATFCAVAGIFHPLLGIACGVVAPSGWQTLVAQWEAGQAEGALQAQLQQQQPISNAWENCDFQTALGLAQGLNPPPSWLQTVLPNLQKGAAAQSQVMSLLGQANAASDPAQKQQLLNQALAAAGDVSCLKNQVSGALQQVAQGTPTNAPPDRVSCRHYCMYDYVQGFAPGDYMFCTKIDASNMIDKNNPSDVKTCRGLIAQAQTPAPTPTSATAKILPTDQGPTCLYNQSGMAGGDALYSYWLNGKQYDASPSNPGPCPPRHGDSVHADVLPVAPVALPTPHPPPVITAPPPLATPHPPAVIITPPPVQASPVAILLPHTDHSPRISAKPVHSRIHVARSPIHHPKHLRVHVVQPRVYSHPTPIHPRIQITLPHNHHKRPTQNHPEHHQF